MSFIQIDYGRVSQFKYMNFFNILGVVIQVIAPNYQIYVLCRLFLGIFYKLRHKYGRLVCVIILYNQ